MKRRVFIINNFMASSRKVIAIIPARGGSKGIPRKNIKLLAGKPLIAYSIEAALKSKYIDKIIVSTEDDEIAEISKNYGAEIIKRPEELARDDSTTIEVVKHVLGVLEKENKQFGIIILLQPTSPLRKTEDIDKATELFLKGTCESIVSVCEAVKNPHWSLKIKDNYLKPLFDWNFFLNKRRQELPTTYFLNGAIYITTVENLIKYNSFFNEKVTPYFMPSYRSVDIDEPLDFKFAEFLLCEQELKSEIEK